MINPYGEFAMSASTSGPGESVAYRAACPRCGKHDAGWLGWTEHKSLRLRVDCQWCALSELVRA